MIFHGIFFTPLWIHARPSGRVMVSWSWKLCVQRKNKGSMTRRRARMPTLVDTQPWYLWGSTEITGILPDMTTHSLCVLYSLHCMSWHPTLVSLGLRCHHKDTARQDNSLSLYTLLFAVHEPTPNPGIFGAPLTSQGYCQTRQLIDFLRSSKFFFFFFSKQSWCDSPLLHHQSSCYHGSHFLWFFGTAIQNEIARRFPRSVCT